MTEACFFSDLHTLTIGITQIPKIIYDKCSSRSICVCVNASVRSCICFSELNCSFRRVIVLCNLRQDVENSRED